MTSQATHHTAQLNGTKLHYVVDGSGPPVLLLHGWPQTSYSWRRVTDLLTDDFTVIAPDLRGFGYSSKPATGYDCQRLANDVAALGEHLDLHEVTVLGHDWGGVVAYLYAATSDQVAALGIVEMTLPGAGVIEAGMNPRPGGEFLWHLGFHSVPDIPEMLIRGHEREYLRWFFEHFAYDPAALTEEELHFYVASLGQAGALRGSLAVYQEFFTTAAQVAEHAATPLTMPVRAFGGEACMGEAALESVRFVAPGATGGVIERCGHWVAEERPDFVAGVVRELAAAR